MCRRLILTYSMDVQAGSDSADTPRTDAVRNPLARSDVLLAARSRPMAERLELALSWNALAAELRMGMRVATKGTARSGD